MRKSDVTPQEVESEFGIDELFFSTTCAKGRITGCNDVFVRVSEYTSEDLLGQPHNLVRHPDMPRCVFRLLWRYLLEGRAIGAYVKNMSRTGRYYWVFALTTPISGGFLSIRCKPTSPVFEAVQALYAELLEHERSFGADWRRGMRSAEARMEAAVEALGFESYDDFMSQALQLELTERAARLGAAGARQLAELDKVKVLRSARDQLSAKKAYFLDLGAVVRLVALNSRVATTQLSEHGRALGCISARISTASDAISTESRAITGAIAGLRDQLHQASFLASFRLLQREMIQLMDAANTRHTMPEHEQRAAYGRSFAESREVLAGNLAQTDAVCREQLDTLVGSLRSFTHASDNLLKALLTIQMGYMTGRTVAVGIEGAERFSLRLDQVAELSTDARGELAAMQDVVAFLRVSAEALAPARRPAA